MQDEPPVDLLTMTADIVSSFVSHNQVRSAELSDLVLTVHASLWKILLPVDQELSVELKPAVPVKKSITDDYLVCLDDGRRLKSLKRHLNHLA